MYCPDSSFGSKAGGRVVYDRVADSDSQYVGAFVYYDENIGLLDTYGALILPYTAFEPIAIFLAMAYMSSIPREIEEAAMIDGAAGGESSAE